jgi:RNA polymerase sigma factor (sigma-70 family)
MSACPSPEGRNALVVAHLAIARAAARSMARRGEALLRAGGALEDLEQEACLCLLRCAELWDPDRDTPFKHYARRALKRRLQDTLGPWGVIRVPRASGRRGGLPVPFPEVVPLPPNADELTPVLDPELEPADAPDPATLAALRRALDSLPPRERQLLTWKFVDGLKGTPLGRRAGVSKSRASRLVRQALARLRGMLGEEEGP